MRSSPRAPSNLFRVAVNEVTSLGTLQWPSKSDESWIVGADESHLVRRSRLARGCRLHGAESSEGYLQGPCVNHGAHAIGVYERANTSTDSRYECVASWRGGHKRPAHDVEKLWTRFSRDPDAASAGRTASRPARRASRAGEKENRCRRLPNAGRKRCGARQESLHRRHRAGSVCVPGCRRAPGSSRDNRKDIRRCIRPAPNRRRYHKGA